MTSLSKTNFDNDYKCAPKDEELGLFISKCGESGQAVIVDETPGGTVFPTAALTIDTSKFCNPCTKLEFTSNLIGTLFAGTINFQVFKTCNNGPQTPVGGQFSFTVGLPSLIATAFTFFVCDCNSCTNGCCTYIVIVTTGGPIVGNIGVFAAKLMATTVENSDQCC